MSDSRTETQLAIPQLSILPYIVILGGLDCGFAASLNQLLSDATSVWTYVAILGASGAIGGALGWWFCVLLPGKSTSWHDILAGVVSFLAGSLAFAVLYVVVINPYPTMSVMNMWYLSITFVVLTPIYWGVLIIPIAWAFLYGLALRFALRDVQATRNQS